MTYGNTPTEAVILNDPDTRDDWIAVLYENGAQAPIITVTQANAGVFTVLADGIPVAVVASAVAELRVSDVVLVERNADGSAPLHLRS